MADGLQRRLRGCLSGVRATASRMLPFSLRQGQITLTVGMDEADDIRRRG